LQPRVVDGDRRFVSPPNCEKSMQFDIPDSELQWRFGPSGGPGGQHANKSSTRAELRFRIEDSRAFDEPLRERLVQKLGVEVRITEDGSRSQVTNRKQAARRLNAILEDAARPDPPSRRTTRPSRAARRRRLDEKRARGETKRTRKPPAVDG
jgi:ribosome-associated protein